MADTAISVTAPRASIRQRWVPVWVVGGIAVFAVGLALSDSFSLAGLSNFMVIFSSLLVGAVPLVVMGAFVGAAIATFVPASAFARIGRLPEALQVPAAGLAGFAFPVCECGSVPVARRLVERGVVPSAAVTFMLAAPILNPIVVLSTSLAYRGRDIFWPMVLGRAGLGLLCAIAVGWVVGSRGREGFLKPAATEGPNDCGCETGATCAAHDDGHGHDHVHGPETGSRWSGFFGYFAGDFVYMGRFLIFGAAVAAALQTMLPQSLLNSVANTPVISLLALMALAFALSLCSESDAFVAASFVQFGVGPQLAFLVFGPMVDAKLTFLYSATFTRGFFRTVVAVVAVVTLIGTLWIEVLVG